MKNKKFFYEQYNKIDWQNQEKTKINQQVYNFIIKEIINEKKGTNIRIFDIGFGIGIFMETLYKQIKNNYNRIIIEGCEPSDKNYQYFTSKKLIRGNNLSLKTYPVTLEDVKTNEKFDFITSTYTFTSFLIENLEDSANKIRLMLDKDGKFILVVAEEKYLRNKLSNKKDLFIEENMVKINGKEYKEFLHYSDIPKIGKVIDYNREEALYLDLFKRKGFDLIRKDNLNDSGFICTIFVFQRNN